MKPSDSPAMRRRRIAPLFRPAVVALAAALLVACSS
jgi:hypothetical protein